MIRERRADAEGTRGWRQAGRRGVHELRAGAHASASHGELLTPFVRRYFLVTLLKVALDFRHQFIPCLSSATSLW